MQNTEQVLGTAIAELRCVRPGEPASLDELTALAVARRSIDELLRACVDELRIDPHVTYSWSKIAYALGSSSTDAVRQQYAPANSPVGLDEQVAAFWEEFAEQFAWDFLPSDFLYELYTSWVSDRSPDADPLSHETFSRRLKTTATASGEWIHTRSRPGSFMNATEPLLSLVPCWSPNDDNKALYGLRRISTTSTPGVPEASA